MKICPQCQLEYDDKFSFCKQCGQKLEVVQVQQPQGVQKVSTNIAVENSAKENSDSKKWIFIVCGIVIVALIAFFATQNSVNKNKQTASLSSQNMMASTNNDISKNKAKEEAEKRAKEAVEKIKQKNQAMNNANNTTSLPFEPKIKGYIAGTDVFMRSGPGKQYKTEGVFAKGEYVEVMDERAEWAKVQTTNGKIAWVFKQYLSLYRDEMPSAEMSLGGITPLVSTLRDVKGIYGEPSDKKIFKGEGAYVVTYIYGSDFRVVGRTGIPRDNSIVIVENNLPVIGYSIKANNLSTQSGIKVGMPYQKVVDLYGVGREYKKDGEILYYYSNKRMQSLSFDIDKNGIITKISTGQEW